MPTFSIIIPTYNSEKFIRRTIKSILDQTFKDFELIIVDDGSTDGTVNIVREIENKEKRIRLIASKNSGGPTVPTNIGLESSRGSLISFLDHDDEWTKNKLELIHKTFRENPTIGFIASNVEVFKDSSKISSVSKAPIKNNTVSIRDMLGGNYFNTFSMLNIRREILDKVGMLDTDFFVFADYEIIVRMITQSIPFIFITEPLVIYHVHENNASSIEKTARRRIQDLKGIAEKYKMKFEENKKSLSRIFHAIARLNLYLGNKKEAVLYFKKSLAYDKLNLATYIRLLIAHFGEGFYTFFNRLKNRTLRKI